MSPLLGSPLETRQRWRIVLVRLALIGALSFEVGCCPDPSNCNLAGYLGWRGYFDTDLQVSQFIGGEHTMMCRVMLQYPNGASGAFITNSNYEGSDFFFLGQGDRDAPPAEHTKLQVTLGSETRFYALDQLPRGQWLHVALVRTAPGEIEVYLDGDLKQGCCPEPFMAPEFSFSTSTVRLGRCYSGKSFGTYDVPQLYGFIDDVAIYTKALTESQIAAISSADRFDDGFYYSDLLVAWTFDAALPSGDPLPAKFWTANPETQFQGKSSSGRRNVSVDRNDTDDARLLPLPFHYSELQLPFAAGVPYLVMQEFASTGSHDGSNGAFCWDFRLAPEYVGHQPWVESGSPPSSCGQPIYAAADGSITNDATSNLLDTGGYYSACDDHFGDGVNRVKIHTPANEVYTARHTAIDSIAEALDLPSGASGPYLPQEPFPVWVGTKIAELGYSCPDNCHLHMGCAGYDDAGIYHLAPMGFSNYYVANPLPGQSAYDVDVEWEYVAFGVPRDEQWIKHYPPLPEGEVFVGTLETDDESMATLAAVIEMETVLGTANGEVTAPAAATAFTSLVMEGGETPEHFVVEELGISLRGLRPQLAVVVSDSGLAVNIEAHVWTCQLDSAGPFGGFVDEDGRVQFDGTPLLVDADLSLFTDLGHGFDLRFTEVATCELEGTIDQRVDNTSLSLTASTSLTISVPEEDLPPGLDSITLALVFQLPALELHGSLFRRSTEPPGERR